MSMTSTTRIIDNYPGTGWEPIPPTGGNGDQDGDGIPDLIDPDDNGDGIPDVEQEPDGDAGNEMPGDPSEDGDDSTIDGSPIDPDGPSVGTDLRKITVEKDPESEAFEARQKGTRQADVLIGSSAVDEIRTKGGDDSISGRGGNDYLFTGRGDDTLLGGKGSDVLQGKQGRDLLDGGPHCGERRRPSVRRETCRHLDRRRWT